MGKQERAVRKVRANKGRVLRSLKSGTEGEANRERSLNCGPCALCRRKGRRSLRGRCEGTNDKRLLLFSSTSLLHFDVAPFGSLVYACVRPRQAPTTSCSVSVSCLYPCNPRTQTTQSEDAMPRCVHRPGRKLSPYCRALTDLGFYATQTEPQESKVTTRTSRAVFTF